MLFKERKRKELRKIGESAGIRVPKVRLRVFDKLKNEIQKFITKLCF